MTRGMPKGRRYANDRVPTIEEIQRIVEYLDTRIKPILFTIASSGIRLGAWRFLKWGQVSPVEKDSNIVAPKIRVYAGIKVKLDKFQNGDDAHGVDYYHRHSLTRN